MKYKVILLPFLFTLYGVLSLVANNIAQVDLADLQTLFFSTIACAFILLFFRIIIKDVNQASLISSGAIISIFTFGHVKTLLLSRTPVDSVNWTAVINLIGWLLFLSYAYLVLRVIKKHEAIVNYLFTVGVILLVFPIYSLLSYYHQTSRLGQNIQEFQTAAYDQYGVFSIAEEIKHPENPPDVFYIILDAYSRSDILEGVYGYDNAPFIESLEDRGFYVAQKSNSNYASTIASLGSSLNMIHLNTIPDYVVHGNVNRDWVTGRTVMDTLQNNRVMEIFKQQGYQTVSYDSGFEMISFADIDLYMTAPAIEESNYKAKNMFEIFILDTFIEDIYKRFKPSQQRAQMSSLYDAHRERLKFTFQTLPEFASMEGNYFVFAHIVAPHPPFVFGPNGEEIDGQGAFTLADTNISNRDISLYLGELHYINQLVVELVDQIVASSDVPPIIIIQADHGSRIFETEDPSPALKRELFFPILNAYYFPDVNDVLYPTISPVNSFRLVLNNYFGTNLPLLPDDSYFWDKDTDFDFVPVQSE